MTGRPPFWLRPLQKLAGVSEESSHKPDHPGEQGREQSANKVPGALVGNIRLRAASSCSYANSQSPGNADTDWPFHRKSQLRPKGKPTLERPD